MRKAFTLAEVLITLAIIGVVAAMTIPTLVTQNQEKGWNTSATVFERKLGEALSIMNTQQTLAGLGTTENFVAELSKHFKIVNTCDNTNLYKCFESSFIWDNYERNISNYKTAKDFMQDDWHTNLMGIQTASGVSALIAYNPRCTADPYSNQAIGVGGGVDKNNGSVKISTGCLAVLYDVQGNSKPNTQAKDVRGINVNFPKCLEGTCYKPAFLANTNPIDCANSDTTINPDFQYCNGTGYYSDDYWAAAIKACGGASKMANRIHLAQIANYIYGTTACKDKQNCSNLGNWDEARGARAAEFGLPSSAGFWVWSAGGNGGNRAWSRHFDSTNSNVNSNSYRRYQDGWVLCLED